MPDLMSVQPVTGMGNAPRPTPPAPEPAIKKPVDTGASNSATDYSDAGNSSAAVQTARDAAKDRTYGEDVLTGPPPTFEASLLEIEGDLEMIIKRMDAARERARDSEAIATSAPAAVTSADTEADGVPAADAEMAQPEQIETAPAANDTGATGAGPDDQAV